MDPAQLAGMMDNPYMQQMMANALNDPAMVQQLTAMDPQLGMALQNPQMRAMLTNPQMLRQLSNPQVLQAMQQMQQSMQTLQGAGILPPGGMGTNPYANPFSSPFGLPASGGGNPVGGLNFSSLLGSGAAAPAAPPVDPAVRFASQLQQLQDMGFGDQAANLRALQATSGNVNAAVERLLNGN
ncbi:hypothetical protein EON65_28955 [archaeon]|nr:MAG: hypothetical protein EON65_28955 [archaeon]